MTKDLSDNVSDDDLKEIQKTFIEIGEPELPKGFVQIGESIYFHTNYNLGDLFTGRCTLLDYVSLIPRKINDYLLDAFRD